MSYQSTSADAYTSVQDKLSEKQMFVYGLLSKLGNKTNQEIAEDLGWQINTVTPRTGELVKYRLVEAKGIKVGKTGRRAIVWGIV